jgi:hypothetical protein
VGGTQRIAATRTVFSISDCHAVMDPPFQIDVGTVQAAQISNSDTSRKIGSVSSSPNTDGRDRARRYSTPTAVNVSAGRTAERGG